MTDSRKISILYGSQTGTAQDVAERIWRDARTYHLSGPVKPMNEYPLTNFLYDNIVVFVCSTTGQGEEPDNMKTFWKIMLRKSLPNNSLSHVRFAVLGLGDSSYSKFNFVAKRLHKRMLQLGALSLIPISLADDQHDLGIDVTVEPFLVELWNKILNLYPLPDGLSILTLPPENLDCRWKTVEVDTTRERKFPKSVYSVRNDPNLIKVKIKKNSRITDPNHFQDVRLIQFTTQELPYNPGDVLMIRPKNSDEQVSAFFQVLHDNKVQLSPDTLVRLTQRDRDMPVPMALDQVLSLGQICKEYWDLSAIPRRYTFNILAFVTTSTLEKEKCQDFTTPEGQYDLYSYCNRPRRTIVEVLQDFPHATSKLTLDMLFEMLHPIRPRAFSIASSSLAHQNEVHILVAVVKYYTPLRAPRLGLCSNWLAGLKKGDDVDIWVKPGTFQFPKDPKTPVIMIGPGTGLAPFRSYLFQRDHENTANKDNLILFFGCRHKEADFHCKADLLKMEIEDKLTIICAFSRDQEHKVYVQHKILENPEMLWETINNRNGTIFVAGNSKNMPAAVREAIMSLCQNCGSMKYFEACQFLEKMEKDGRYQCETWN